MESQLLLTIDRVESRELGGDTPTQNEPIVSRLTIFRVHYQHTLNAETADVPPSLVSVPVLTVQDGLIAVVLAPDTVIHKQGDLSVLIQQKEKKKLLQLTFGSIADVVRLEEFLAHFTAYEVPSLHRNELALVDQHTGEVVAIMDRNLEPAMALSPSDTMTVIEYDPNGEKQYTVIRKAADALVKSSEWISNVMTQGAVLVGQSLSGRAEKIKSSMGPSQAQPVQFSANMKKNIQDARAYSKTAKQMSGTLKQVVRSAATKIGGKLAAFLAPPASKQGEPVQPESDLKYLLRQGLIAMDNVVEGFEQSFMIVASEGGRATVQLVQHKYGEDAGSLANDAAHTLGNLSVVYFDAKGMSRKALIKVVGKTAAKDVAKTVAKLQ